MSGMIDSYEAAVLDHITAGAGTTVSPTNWYVVLLTAPPAEDGTGGTEVSTTSTAYARTSMSAGDWAAATGAQPSAVANSAVVQFPTATGNWGTVTHFGLAPAGVAGVADVKIWTSLNTSRTIVTGNDPSFAAGALVIQLGDPGDVY